MKLKIFQAYYKPDQIKYLDPEFYALDNTKNLQGEYREYPIFLECRRIAEVEQLDVWGYISWKWKDKLPGMKAEDIVNRIRNNPYYDVYFWNPWSNYAVSSLNVWEQGQLCHPDMITIMHHIFPKIGVNPNWLYQPMHPDCVYFGLYCAGNSKFWNGFLKFANSYVNIIDTLPDTIKKMHNSGAKYPPFPDLWYFPFIHERLLSTYLTLNYDKLRILPYQHRPEQYGYMWDRLYFLKTMALKYKEISILEEWQHLRTYLGLDFPFSKNWIAKFDKNLINIYNKSELR